METLQPNPYLNGVLPSAPGCAPIKGVTLGGPPEDLDNDGLDRASELTFGTSPCDPDTDGDGCLDGAEVQMGVGSEVTGGRRYPLNEWDFFDVNGDKNIDVPNDILPVILAYLQGPNDPGGPGPGYSPSMDRGPPLVPPPPFGLYPWSRSGPDGRIDVVNDILPIIFQYLHSCA